MYLCVCKAVSERTARRAIQQDGVVSLRDLTRTTGLGTGCGKCVPAARQFLQQELADGAAGAATRASTMGSYTQTAMV